MPGEFEGIDGDLNIFALANGLDLTKDASGRPDRTLEWFRDGMDRRIRIVAASGDAPRYDVYVEAWRKKDGVRQQALRTVKSSAEIREGLRSLLAELIELANGIAESDLAPEEA